MKQLMVDINFKETILKKKTGKSFNSKFCKRTRKFACSHDINIF
jgi:hypothetical protein